MKRTYVDINNANNYIPNKVILVDTTATSQGIQFNNSYATTESSLDDLIELTADVQKEDNFVRINVPNKFHRIKDHMKFLRDPAENFLDKSKENAILDCVSCNFVKRPQNIYHLYEKPSGQLYFSMLSPVEWGICGPAQIFKGSYRLECDYSWTLIS